MIGRVSAKLLERAFHPIKDDHALPTVVSTPIAAAAWRRGRSMAAEAVRSMQKRRRHNTDTRIHSPRPSLHSRLHSRRPSRRPSGRGRHASHAPSVRSQRPRATKPSLRGYAARHSLLLQLKRVPRARRLKSARPQVRPERPPAAAIKPTLLILLLPLLKGSEHLLSRRRFVAITGHSANPQQLHMIIIHENYYFTINTKRPMSIDVLRLITRYLWSKL